jgi:hypothetical protein
VEHIPVEQIVPAEGASLAEKVRELLEFAGQVIQVPWIGGPVMNDRLEEGGWIVKELAERLVRKVGRPRLVGLDGDPGEKMKGLSESSGALKVGEHQSDLIGFCSNLMLSCLLSTLWRR